MQVRSLLMLCVLALACSGAAGAAPASAGSGRSADEAPPPGTAAADATPEPPADAKERRCHAHVLLDRKLGAQRDGEVRLAQSDALHGDPLSQYLLGTLYRLGQRHPAALFERDDDKAATFLSNAAIHGQLYAMAAMAELELRPRRPTEAMIWAQAFTLYQKESPAGAPDDHQAYAAYLLQRCFEKVGRDEETMHRLEQ